MSGTYSDMDVQDPEEVWSFHCAMLERERLARDPASLPAGSKVLPWSVSSWLEGGRVAFAAQWRALLRCSEEHRLEPSIELDSIITVLRTAVGCEVFRAQASALEGACIAPH